MKKWAMGLLMLLGMGFGLVCLGADFNGDGSDDIGVFRPGDGLWSIRGVTRAYFGSAGGNPAPGDYNGDGKADMALHYPSTGLWAVRGVTRAYFGSSSDITLGGNGGRWLPNGNDIYYNAGRVGIGTTGSWPKLEVSGTTKLSNATGDSWFPFSDGNSYMSGTNLLFRSNGNTENMILTSAGNVGIGTMNPICPLHVDAGSASTVPAEFDGSSSGGTGIIIKGGSVGNLQVALQRSSSSWDWWLGRAADDDRFFIQQYLNPSDIREYFSIDTGGLTEVKALYVYNPGATTTSWIGGQAGSQVNFGFIRPGEAQARGGVLLRPDNKLSLAAGNGSAPLSEVLTVTSAYRVGINTVNPAGELDVNGSIFQRGAVLHPDYVFKPSYVLESIEDHARYMWENKHLKALPGASRDENGREIIEVGAQTRGTLEELEKAHIYIEQLHNRLKLLEEKIVKLEGSAQ
jgi:hypothetical protein